MSTPYQPSLFDPPEDQYKCPACGHVGDGNDFDCAGSDKPGCVFCNYCHNQVDIDKARMKRPKSKGAGE